MKNVALILLFVQSLLFLHFAENTQGLNADKCHFCEDIITVFMYYSFHKPIFSSVKLQKGTYLITNKFKLMLFKIVFSLTSLPFIFY